MNLANRITLLRVVMIPLFLVVLYAGFPGSRYIALAVFIVASLTDFLDGYIARTYNQTTDFGKFLDPLADKLLVVSAMLFFAERGQMAGWAVFLVIAREFAVTGLRLVAVDKGRVIAAGWSGKVKTATTMVCVCIMLTDLFRLSLGSVTLNGLCVFAIVVTTVYSGAEYFIRNADVLRAS